MAPTFTLSLKTFNHLLSNWLKDIGALGHFIREILHPFVLRISVYFEYCVIDFDTWVGVLAEVFRAKWSRPRQHQWRQDGAEGRVNNLQEDISPRAWSSNRKLKDKKDRNTCIVDWIEISLFFFALDIRSYPNLFLVFHHEIKRIVPIFVAKSFQIETFDLKSLIRPAVFDPITSNPNQVSFNINLQINRSQFELFSRHNQL